MLTGRPNVPEFFDGKVTKWVEAAGLTLGEIVYLPQFERPTHMHERACLHLNLSGGYTEYQQKKSFECNTLTLSFQPQGHEHSYRCYPTQTRAFTIEIDTAWIERLREHSVILDAPVSFHEGLLPWITTRLYNEFCTMETSSALVIEGLALEILVEASRKPVKIHESKAPVWFKSLDELLRMNFAEPLSLSDIARTIRLHPVHLARAFRQYKGCTIGEYVRKLRIEFACRQLSQTESTLLEIALASGFSDQSHFSRTFKRLLGLTPARFRSEFRSR